MSHKYEVTYTDTYGGEANFSWVHRATIIMPELTEFGYDGSTNYVAANKRYVRRLMRLARAEVGLTGVKGETVSYGDVFEFRPHRLATILFVEFVE